MTTAELTRQATSVVASIHQQLPVEIKALAVRVPVHYQDRPHPSLLAEGFEPDILGLFTGNSHGSEFSHPDPAPPQILLYLENLWDLADGDLAVFHDEVRVTYLHELGHYFGWDEDDLADRGLE